MIEDKTAIVVVASYRSVSSNPVRFKAVISLLEYDESHPSELLNLKE